MRRITVFLIICCIVGCAGSIPEPKYDDGQPIPEEELKRFEKNKNRKTHTIGYSLISAAIVFIPAMIAVDENSIRFGSAGGGAVLGLLFGYSQGKKKDRETAIDLAKEYKTLKKEEKQQIDKIKSETDKIKSKINKSKGKKKPPF